MKCLLVKWPVDEMTSDETPKHQNSTDLAALNGKKSQDKNSQKKSAKKGGRGVAESVKTLRLLFTR